MSTDASTDRPVMARWQRWPLWIGVAALCIAAAGSTQSVPAFFRAYLAAYLFYLGLSLGSMALLMVYHLTGGSWGLLIRRILEAGMRTLPLMVVLFVPIAVGLRYLYPWAQPEMVAQSAKLQYQQFYLNPTFFWIRAAVYFAVWLAIAFLLSRWSFKEDAMPDRRPAWKSLNFSGPAAVAYGITLHFAAVDWAMSLQPVFHSTIWGPLFAAGQLLSALALAVVMLARFVDRPPLADLVSRKVLGDLGSLLLTLLILWAYLAWFQFMLVWIANMRVDVVWYLARSSVGWLAVIWAIVVLHFVVPFFLLLMRPIKRNPAWLAGVAGLILLMQFVHMGYQILPTLTGQSLGGYWMAVVMPVGIGGIWLACFWWQLSRRPLLARHDANQATALHLRQLEEEEAAREEKLAYG